MLVGGPLMKAGHFQAGEDAYELVLGFTPNYLRLYNLNAATGEVIMYEYFRDMGDRMISSPGLVMGTTKTLVGYVGFDYNIAGTDYHKDGDPVGEAPGTDVVPQNQYGAVAFDIGADKVVDLVKANDNATGYGSAVLALRDTNPPAAGHARLGYVTVTKSDGSFTFGTTDFDAANVTAAFISCKENAICRRQLADNGSTGERTIENLKSMGGDPLTFNQLSSLDKGTVQTSPTVKNVSTRGIRIETDWLNDNDEIYFLAVGNIAETDLGDVA
jgi:hypothetical protein